MPNLMSESEVSLDSLAAHLENAGWTVEQHDNHLRLRSDAGYSYSLQLDTERCFISFSCFYPIDKDYDEPLELVNRLNAQVFLATFSIDTDRDLRITYAMSYSRGLIVPQFSRMVRRFGSLIEYVRNEYDTGGRVFNIGGEDAEAGENTEERVLQ